MLVTPRGTAAAALYDFKDRVDPHEVVRKYRRAALLGISRQPIGINASSAIDRIPILINRRIENHCRSDFGAVGGGRRQAVVIGILENYSCYIGRTTRHHGKQARPRVGWE